jgi:hypothetical protein
MQFYQTMEDFFLIFVVVVEVAQTQLSRGHMVTHNAFPAVLQKEDLSAPFVHYFRHKPAPE